jgi:hypothetical protein
MATSAVSPTVVVIWRTHTGRLLNRHRSPPPSAATCGPLAFPTADIFYGVTGPMTEDTTTRALWVIYGLVR